jgi:two-component system nitrogen regulation sensor histidine kinase NtrY
MTRRTKTILYVFSILAITAILVYLETNLPFFRKFMPVLDNKFIIAILNINFLLILLLIFLATRIILKNYIERRRGVWGSGLKTKLTVTVFVLSMVSSVTLFVLTSWFFYISIDRWIGEKIEDTVENAQELSRFYYEDLFGRYEKMGGLLATTLREEKALDDDRELTKFVRKEGRSNFLGYLAVLNLSGEPIKSYSTLDRQVSTILAEKSRTLVRKGQVREIVPLKDGELLMFLSTVTDDGGQPRALLFLGERLRVRGTQSMKQISSAYAEFKENSRAEKKILKYDLWIPLFLVAILCIFLSIWVGGKMSTEITTPLELVREGAAIIAGGRFDINLEERGKDEIGTLVTAFNGMARELKIAKDEIEERRRYMEVIVDNVATGIITTDVRGNVLLLNRAAKDILKVQTDDYVGRPLRAVIGEDFRRSIRSFLRLMRADGAEGLGREMTLSLQNDTLYVRASLTALRDEETGKPQGFIATFDDITHIVRAEKLATWREIAKRLTHEIKNPLTPIRLSAERLRRRVLPKAEGKEKDVLDEATSIILTSSEDINTMVSELTKLSQTTTDRTVEDVNSVVEEALGIYRNLYPHIAFRFLDTKIPPFSMDRDKMKRALINLITNSIRAIGADPGTIEVKTRYDRNRGMIRIEVADTGPGVDDEDKLRIFDPYFTHDPNGTGLGLAIVNSVILEHGGRINALDNTPKGTKMVIELPATEV